MKNKTGHILKTRLLLGLTIIAALCTALSVRAALPYPTASTVSQYDADINYANANGGTFTINLQLNTSITNGGGTIGGTKAVNLTIFGNGATFDGLVPGFSQFGSPNPSGSFSRFFVVAAGSSLTLEQMTLQNGYVFAVEGGAIYNSGKLTISNCTLSGNSCFDNSGTGYGGGIGVGGAIYNHGTVIIDNSILSDNLATGYNPMGGAIYNASGMVTISNSTFINNYALSNPYYFIAGYQGQGGAIFNAGGTVTISHSSLITNVAPGAGGIYNGGTVTVENSSKISGNTGEDVANGSTLYLDSSSEIAILDGNPAIIVQGSGPSPSPRISLTTSNAVVISWPYPSTGWSLHQNSDLTTTNWVASTNTVANDGTNNFIIATPSLDQLFFRLEF